MATWPFALFTFWKVWLRMASCAGPRCAVFSAAQCIHNPRALTNRVDLVSYWQLHRLFDSGWPVDLGGAGVGRIAQTKMGALVARGDEAAAAHDVFALPHAICIQINCRAHGIARALRSAHELQLHPVMMVGV